MCEKLASRPIPFKAPFHRFVDVFSFELLQHFVYQVLQLQFFLYIFLWPARKTIYHYLNFKLESKCWDALIKNTWGSNQLVWFNLTDVLQHPVWWIYNVHHNGSLFLPIQIPAKASFSSQQSSVFLSVSTMTALFPLSKELILKLTTMLSKLVQSSSDISLKSLPFLIWSVK